MNPLEFQPIAREIAQRTHIAAAERLAVLAADPNLDPELAIKIHNATIPVAQAVPEKKQDINIGLPVLQFTFISGGLQATAHDLPMVEVVGEDQLLHLQPSMAMLARLVTVNADLKGLDS